MKVKNKKTNLHRGDLKAQEKIDLVSCKISLLVHLKPTSGPQNLAARRTGFRQPWSKRNTLQIVKIGHKIAGAVIEKN